MNINTVYTYMTTQYSSGNLNLFLAGLINLTLYYKFYVLREYIFIL